VRTNAGKSQLEPKHRFHAKPQSRKGAKKAQPETELFPFCLVKLVALHENEVMSASLLLGECTEKSGTASLNCDSMGNSCAGRRPGKKAGHGGSV
jgi:hypothetical protein